MGACKAGISIGWTLNLIKTSTSRCPRTSGVSKKATHGKFELLLPGRKSWSRRRSVPRPAKRREQSSLMKVRWMRMGLARRGVAVLEVRNFVVNSKCLVWFVNFLFVCFCCFSPRACTRNFCVSFHVFVLVLAYLGFSGVGV